MLDMLAIHGADSPRCKQANSADAEHNLCISTCSCAQPMLLNTISSESQYTELCHNCLTRAPTQSCRIARAPPAFKELRECLAPSLHFSMSVGEVRR